MANWAKAVALLAALCHVTAMRGVAQEPALPPMGPEGAATAPADDRFSVPAERQPDDSSDLPADATDHNATDANATDANITGTTVPAVTAPIPALAGLPSRWLLSEPVHRANFYAAVEAVSLAREIDEDRVFATLNTPTNDVLNLNDLGFHQQPGIRVVIGAKLTDWYSIEMTAMGFSDWKESAAVSDATLNPGGTAGNLFSPFTGFGSPPEEGLDFNDAASIRLVSALDTLEWNVRQRLSASDASFGATALYGFRYLSFDELLEYRTHSTLPQPVGSINAVDIAIDNHLYGIQLGGALDYRRGPYWISFEGKAALCHNAIVEDATASQVSRADPVDAPLDYFRDEGAAAFVGHLSTTVEYRFSEHWVGRIGYQALFVDGLALASESTPALLLHDKSAIFHGPIAGLVVSW